MLKAQIGSKIGLLGAGWKDIEDILTGDFFGALDYLPRQPFLRSFFEWVAVLNSDAIHPAAEGVDWDSIEFVFWPMITGADESAEPDLLIISNRWLVAIEVKLDSGLGVEQPWREFCVGREIALERGLPDHSVFYWLVTRQRLKIEETFTSTAEHGRKELLAKSSHLLWHQVVALIERWLKGSGLEAQVRPEHLRLLLDLLHALRRRRTIAFSGFAFTNQEDVDAFDERLFCPDRFAGFLEREARLPIPSAEQSRFLARFDGFRSANATISRVSEKFFVPDVFDGFGDAMPVVRAHAEPILRSDAFSGFLNDCPACIATSTLDVRGG